MISFSQVWLPILLSAVAVFVASSIIHMASPWHKNDYPKLVNEDAVMAAMHPLAIPPGDYSFPRPVSMADMKSPAFMERLNRGPNVIMTVLPNGYRPMGPIFVQWFVYLLFVSALAAHVAARGLPANAPGAHVFHETALVTFGAYALGLWQLSIWYSRSWSITLKSTVDAAIYAVITGLVFQLMWPR
jgi:hypothetical protein